MQIERTDGTIAYEATNAATRRAAVTAAGAAGAALTGADLTGADLTGANLRGADLRGADLTGANLRGADLRGAYLTRADLTRAYLAGADLTRAYLRGADLTGADLARADGVLAIGPIDTWIMYAVRFPYGPRIKAGCRWFTEAEARKWWGKGGAAQDTVTHGPRMLAGVDALMALAKAHGWEVSQ